MGFSNAFLIHYLKPMQRRKIEENRSSVRSSERVSTPLFVQKHHSTRCVVHLSKSPRNHILQPTIVIIDKHNLLFIHVGCVSQLNPIPRKTPWTVQARLLCEGVQTTGCAFKQQLFKGTHFEFILNYKNLDRQSRAYATRTPEAGTKRLRC